MLAWFTLLIGLSTLTGGAWVILHQSCHAENMFCNYRYCKKNWIKK